MKDHVVRATAAEGMVRAFAAVTTDTVREARELHGLSPVASAALGRTLTGAALMSKMLKGEKDTLTLQIRGDGPLGGIVTVSDSHANVRGYVYNPHVHPPLNSMGKLDVSGAIGPNGYLNVIKDLGLKEPYIGYVNLVSGEIAEDIAYYYSKSEQIPTAVALGVLQKPSLGVISAGGIMVQLLPGAEEPFVERLEELLRKYSSISSLAERASSPKEMLETIFEGVDKKWLGSVSFEFGCRCSRELAKALLLSMQESSEEEVLEVRCHFCNKVYTFTAQEIKGLKGGEED